jgi:hypothetical protein
MPALSSGSNPSFRRVLLIYLFHAFGFGAFSPGSTHCSLLFEMTAYSVAQYNEYDAAAKESVGGCLQKRRLRWGFGYTSTIYLGMPSHQLWIIFLQVMVHSLSESYVNILNGRV